MEVVAVDPVGEVAAGSRDVIVASAMMPTDVTAAIASATMIWMRFERFGELRCELPVRGLRATRSVGPLGHAPDRRS